MKDPVVLITGALTGIGRATALAFANEGGRIVASGRHDAEGHELVADLRKLGAEAEFLRSDVRYEDEVRSLVDQTVAGSVAWTWPSIPPAPKANLAR
jgi:NAD(P)-dependent dehydrogenase (short-subunit alcohol dehydrogenase family)